MITDTAQQEFQKIEVVGYIYDFLKRTKTRKKLCVGGAGSSKSWTIAQYLLFEKFYKEQNIRILVVRKTLPSLRKSCWQLFLDLISKYHLPAKRNKVEMTLTYGSNMIIFASLDDIEKIKSIEGINYIWIEEATEITLKEYMQLGLRPRAPNNNFGASNHMIASFNPIDYRSFLRPLVKNPPNDTSVNHSTYKDNPFLPRDNAEEIENLITQDKTYHTIYAKGEWASPGNIIYTNWKVIPTMPSDAYFTRIGYGLDFGYNLPTALIKIGVKEDRAFEQELLYARHMTNAELIVKLKSLIPPLYRMRPMFADAAEPARIKDIFDAGFNIYGCTKGPGSVKNGIDRVKTLKVFITADSTNLKEEKESYKWKEDKYGNVLDEPVEFDDHLMDAERYYLGEQPMIREQLLLIGSYDCMAG